MISVFQIMAAAILAGFFVIFFGKMAAQKRQGMRTGLFKREGKPAAVFHTEIILKVLVFAVYGAQIASIWLDVHVDCFWLRVAGAAVGIAGVVVFGIAVVTMADSWRTEIPENDRTKLITRGIFRISRNPAFLGFDMMFAGVAAMFANHVLVGLTICCMVMYHLQILQEEKYLTDTFGTPYVRYMRRVRRYLGTKKQR